MKTLRLSALLVLLSTVSYCQSSTHRAMEKEIKQVINDFQQAVAARDLSSLETLLHPDFRVMANRFSGGEGTTLLPRETYLGMMKAEKIGGTAYEVEIVNVAVKDHTAAAEVNFTSQSEADMHLFLLLVQDSNDNWQIISDLPVIIP